jgi:dihydroxyacetone kinase-like protein
MIKDAVDAVIKAILANKDYLSQLDAKIGDGDHGLNMARGAMAVEEVLEELDDAANVKEVLQAVGEAVVMNVGGTAGPLYGAGILEAAKVVDENSKLDAETLEKVFGAVVLAIQRRGRAEKGDKTMLDVLIPIHETFKAENTVGKNFDSILTAAKDAARDGVEFTKTIPARKGRASYFGDKSIGCEDPGAMSSFIIFRTLSGYWKEFNN